MVIRRMLAAVCLLALTLLLPLTAQAAKLTGLYVQEKTGQEKSAQAVEVYKKNSSKYYLFLPAGMDTSALQICFEGPESIALDGQTIRSGETTALLQPGTDMALTWNDEKVRLYEETFVPALKAMLGEGEMEGVTTIQEEAEAIAASAKMNFTRWGYIQSPERYTQCGKNFDAAVEDIQNFLSKRMNALEKRWLKQ